MFVCNIIKMKTLGKVIALLFAAATLALPVNAQGFRSSSRVQPAYRGSKSPKSFWLTGSWDWTGEHTAEAHGGRKFHITVIFYPEVEERIRFDVYAFRGWGRTYCPELGIRGIWKMRGNSVTIDWGRGPGKEDKLTVSPDRRTLKGKNWECRWIKGTKD